MGYYFCPLKRLCLPVDVIFLTRLEELNLVRFVGVKTEEWPPKPEASYYSSAGLERRLRESGLFHETIARLPGNSGSNPSAAALK